MWQAPVHPRACGERLSDRSQEALRAGSSPRLRGTLRRRILRLARGRFIPAPAGNAICRSISATSLAVHPRACGERGSRLGGRQPSAGSSPRLRGTRETDGPHHRRDRFIPAPAGNARRGRRASPPSPVHPRACGERGPAPMTVQGIVGSSPRLRGTRSQACRRTCRRRFIPAPAGNARQVGRKGCLRAVHPRACGERVLNAASSAARSGSSPRLRGTLAPEVVGQLPHRFIPAPAGNAEAA